LITGRYLRENPITAVYRRNTSPDRGPPVPPRVVQFSQRLQQV